MNIKTSTTESPASPPRTARVVIATTVALSFISFWRAAAIVLNDFGSSMFYVGGIATQAVGQAAPWFVLGVMVFSFAVRAVYIEGCSMYVRGGVYVVVRDSMGPALAKVSVSALIFDYLLTGPISGVSAGHYLAGLINETYVHVQGLPESHRIVDPNFLAVLFALLVTGYFWRANVRGIHESSEKALRIMQVTTLMVVALLVWSVVTLFTRGTMHLPPAPVPSNLEFGKDALGWLEGTTISRIASVALVVAFGHAFLSMSGFETLGQVYREIATPKLRNLKITGTLVCAFAFLGTGVITVLASMIVPPSEMSHYADNLIGGLAMNLAGPDVLRLVFHAFVVIVGVAVLSGAINTSLIGANAVLNRVAEDGVLLHWFRKPHTVFGTTYRTVSLVAVLQVLTILWSRGDVYLLGEAYAFGVVWSFFLKSLGVLVLRYQRNDQEYKVPFNFKVRGIEIPFGLLCTTAILLIVALANLFSKQVATVYGVMFTIVFIVLFTLSERANKRKHGAADGHLEQFNIVSRREVSAEALAVRPGSTLVAVRFASSLHHLQWALDTTRGKRQIVVCTIRTLSSREGEYEIPQEQYFAVREQELFSQVVTLAEKAGKRVELLVIPSMSPYDGLVRAAANLRSSLLVVGSSPRLANDELARRIGLSWEQLPEPKHPFALAIVGSRKEPLYVSLGPHAPRLWPEDVDLVHHLCLKLSDPKEVGSKLHHRDVVGYALRRLQEDLESGAHDNLLQELHHDISK